MCTGASLSSNDQQPIRFLGERTLEEGEAVGNVSPSVQILSRMDLLWVTMCLCLAKGAEFVSCSAWRSVMPGESCPLAFISMLGLLSEVCNLNSAIFAHSHSVPDTIVYESIRG